jgi:hypothetical protein
MALAPLSRKAMRALLLAIALAGCAEDAEREPAERRNLAALDTIAVPPGATVLRTETSGRHAPDTSEGPIVGWTTVRELRLTSGDRAEQVVNRARTDLERAGWRIENGADFYLNARRKASCLHFLPLPAEPTDEIQETTATDVAPPGSEQEPGRAIARGLMLSVTDC